jgi:polyphenol oxidase
LKETGFRVAAFDGIELLQCPALADEGVPHGFTLRTGGFGARGNGPADGEKLRHGLGFERFASMHQVHGNEVRVIDGNGAPLRNKCDGIATNEPGVGLVVESADCIPLLLWASKARAVGAVHAGWRGTLAGIASRAISRVQESFGAAPEELVAVLGPSIRVCCYEVGDDVITAFSESGRDVGRMSRPGPRGRRHLDLVEENRLQLEASGVPLERVFDSGLCTRCENDRFYSFRGEGEGVGRIFGVIGIL